MKFPRDACALADARFQGGLFSLLALADIACETKDVGFPPIFEIVGVDFDRENAAVLRAVAAFKN